MAEADSIRLCAHCGKAGTRDKRSQYCSIACKSGAKKIRRRGYNLQPRDKTRQANCLGCGQPFASRPSGPSPTGWTACCSIKCDRARRRRLALAAKPLVVRTIHGHCAGCGKHFVMLRHGTRYCSAACSSYAWQPSIKACAHCHAEFMQERRWQRTCSDACLRAIERKGHRIAKSRRRARIRGADHEAIDPIAVFERDGWRCQLCGVRTPKRLRGTYGARAPELDHIVALADGGTHTWGNVQCACRECNGQKGAESRGQLGLPFAA